MKIKILRVFVTIGQFLLNIIYSLMKIGKTKNRVVLLSRQSDRKSLDFKLLEEYIKENTNIEIICMCKSLGNNLFDKIKYCLYMLKIMNNIAKAKICITDGYSIPVSLLNHKEELTIIQMWHASGATKKFGYQVLDKKEGSSIEIAEIMKMHKNYNYVLAPSKKTGKIFSEAFNVSEDKIKVIGLPRIDYLRKEDKKLEKEFYNDYPNFKNKKVVLYVPTFRKGKTANATELIEKINKDKYALIVRKHPLDTEEIERDYLVDSKYDTMDLLKIADIIITDYSAIAYEASVLNKPIYFYVYDIEEYKENRGLNVDITKEMKEETFKDIDSLVKAIESDSYNFKELYKFRDKYVEVYNENNIKNLTEFIKENMKDN